MIVLVTTQYFPFDFQQLYNLTNCNYKQSNQGKIECSHLIVSQPWFSRTDHLQGGKRQNEEKNAVTGIPILGKDTKEL